MFSAQGVIQPNAPESRCATICFATHAWDTLAQRLVKLNMTGADLCLLNNGRAPPLADYSRSIGSVLGVIESAWIDGDSAYCMAWFSGLDAWTMASCPMS